MSPRRHRRSRLGSALALPTCRDEMVARGWDALDVLLVSGDAYVDHPSFGAAVIGRHLEASGYRVGVIAQPGWRAPDELRRLGRPRLFIGVTAGNLDSMLSKRTAQNKPRRQDLYSPGGQPGLRPDRASIVYANLCRQAWPGVPVVLGGIEASLRRVAHYDYWSDRVRRSVLLDAKADLLVFGMGERAVAEVADRLRAGDPIGAIRDVRGTACVLRQEQWAGLRPSRRVADGGVVVLPSYEQVRTDDRAFVLMTRAVAVETNPDHARPLLQPHGDQAVYLNPPALPLRTSELDRLHELPFTRQSHPSHAQAIPALRTVQHSLVTMRGCFGGCAFCSLTEHQGRRIQSRSAESIVREAAALSRRADFRGTITDVGGPTANMYRLGCRSSDLEVRCRRLSCLYPRVCRHLNVEHGQLVELLRRLRALEGVRHVYIASGIRHDLAEAAPDFIGELARHHTPGQLSLAPEHICPEVLRAMRKPTIESYEHFVAAFERESSAAGREQHCVPYFITGHPGTTLAHMVELARYLERHALRPRQVQDFIPTPMTIATAMFHTGLDPITGRTVPVARTLREKRFHKALALYWDPTHHDDARAALRQAGRSELIGSGGGCLIPPARGRGSLPVRARSRRRSRRHSGGRTGR